MATIALALCRGEGDFPTPRRGLIEGSVHALDFNPAMSELAEAACVVIDPAGFRCIRLVDPPFPYWNAVFEALPDAADHG